MRESIHKIRSNTPSDTHGWNSTVMNSSGASSCGGMPRFRKKLPKTLANTTTVAQIHVLMRSRADSVLIGRLIAGNGRHRRRLGSLLLGHKLFPFAPQRHV